jgi:hypothetical protein
MKDKIWLTSALPQKVMARVTNWCIKPVFQRFCSFIHILIIIKLANIEHKFGKSIKAANDTKGRQFWKKH